MPPTSASKSAPATYTQPSRKGKKAWRKNVDVSEVVTGLEALREEIRITGGPVAEKSDSQLFAIDTTGDDQIKFTHKLTKPLKVDQILAERSAVPAVDSRKRKQGLLGDGVYESSGKRRKEGWVAKKDISRLKASINTTSHLDTNKVASESAVFDLWSIPTATAAHSAPAQKDEYIPKPRAKVAPPTITKPPVAMSASGKPTKSIPKPSAGTSYNPTFEDWDTLIRHYGEAEVLAEQGRLAKAQADAQKQARVDLIAAKPDDGNDGYDTGLESAWEGFETENDDDDDALKKKRPQRKTPQQRKKVERRKERERAERHEAAMGRKAKQNLEAVTALAKANADKGLAEADDDDDSEVEETSEDTQLRRRKMGPVPIPEKQLEVILPDELQDSLRRLKPEGNLMTDRFRNLLVNGKLEARKRILQPKKRKVKVTTKWTHKDFDLGIEV